MKKVFIITAVVLIAAGLILAAGALLLGGKPFAVQYADRTYPVNGAFEQIRIQTAEADIAFARSTDGTCSVVTREAEKVTYSVGIQDNALCVETVDSRTWTDRLFTFGRQDSVTVYLPDKQYADLVIDNDTGDVELPDAFTFGSITIGGSTGNVRCSASASGAIDIRESTGDITLDNVTAKALTLSVSTGKITVNGADVTGGTTVYVSTGKTEIGRLRCNTFMSDGSTGRITLSDVMVSDTLHITRDTGDVTLNRCDAAAITIGTSTGDVTGSLLSEKVFFTKTSTGKIRVPSTAAGGKCEITTDTGDIRIELADAETP